MQNNFKQKLCNSRGQASIEAAVVLKLSIIMIASLFWAAGIGWGYMWSRYQLYESVICLQDRSIYDCQSRFQRKMRSVAPYVRIVSLSLHKSSTKYTGSSHIRISLPVAAYNIEFEKTMPR